jgi:hypothetical protein
MEAKLSVQVIPVRDSQGNVYAYKCPQCQKIHPYESIAEDCLREHAKLLVEG